MKIKIEVFCSMLVAAWLSMPVFAGDPLKVQEPVFGIYYDPHIVHFKKATNIIMPCKKELEGLSKVTVYANWQSKDASYFIVSGLISNAETHNKYESSTALALKIKNDICQSVAGDFFLAGENAPTYGQSEGDSTFDVEEAAVEGITTDILNRYSKAFGSKEKFLTILRQSHFDFNPDPILNPMPSVLRSKLEDFCPNCFRR
jgi:hypothetical protein